MKVFDARVRETQLGFAYGGSVSTFLEENRGLIDYLELPFEQLVHTPALAGMQDTIPFVLHCASLSIAGFVPPPEATVAAIVREATRMSTPWIGEHLAFISADGLSPDGAPTTLTYTACPQLSEDTVARVADNLAALAPRLPVPIILENSPQYFAVPGSTMGMTEFVAAVAERADVGLLLDLTHFLITSINTGVDPRAELDRLPLERVVEMHVSGLSEQSGIAWDDHAAPAPALVFELVERALTRARPRAITLEYNWSPQFPQATLRAHVARLRELIARAAA